MESKDHTDIAERFPKREIYLNGRLYCIHGLVHSNAFVRLSQTFKDEVNRQLSGYEVICEDGFSSWIKGSKSFEEARYFNLNRFSLPATLFALRYVFSRLTPRKEPKIITDVRQMDSAEDLNEIREKLFRGYLPEPEGMNSFLLKKNAGTLDNLEGELPLRTKRYIYEAKKSKEYAEEKNIDELHIVVGCAHELPLEYLLKNTDVLSSLSVHIS